MLKIENLSKSYLNKYNNSTFQVLKNISFQLRENEILSIMGESGSGKTTIARIILGLEKPDQGSILYKGKDLTKLNQKAFKAYRKDIQVISQMPGTSFDPSIKLNKSIIEPLYNFKLKIDENKIMDLFNELKLDKNIVYRYPHQVSGGEIQRLAILRALLLEPKILILDEATSMLDISVQAQILNLLKKLKEKNNMSYIFISHDREVVKLFADRSIEIKNGEIIQ